MLTLTVSFLSKIHHHFLMEKPNKNDVLELIKIRVDATIKNLCACLEKLEKDERRAKENDAI